MRKKATAAALALVLLFGTLTTANAALVAMSVSPLSADSVYCGGSLSFTVNYTGDIDQISLSKSDISFTGFDAKIEIDNYSGEDNERIVTLRHITPDGSGDENRIFIEEGTAVSSDGHTANSAHTSAFAITAPVELGKGRCGDNAYWSFMSDGIFTIYGSGSTWDIKGGGDALAAWDVPGLDENNNSSFNRLETLWKNRRNIENPWFYAGYMTADGELFIHDMGSYANDVRKVVVKKGITRVGDHLFCGNGFVGFDLQEVIIEDGVEEIGESLIDYDNECIIEIPKSVKKIGWMTSSVVIKGYPNSFAETFAEENERYFINIETGSLNVTKAPSKIVINDQTVSESLRYPFILYKNITYFPLTYQNCLFAGLECDFDSKGGELEIKQVAPSEGYEPELGEPSSLTAVPIPFEVSLNGSSLVRRTTPPLLCNGVTYIPLTWDIAVEEFGWSLNFVPDDNGGVLTIDTAPTPQEPASVEEPGESADVDADDEYKVEIL